MLEKLEISMRTWAEEPTEGRKMTDKKENYRTGYSDYETLDEARQQAKRETARGFKAVSIWQRIEETVVPTIDVQINTVDVTTTPVAA